METEEKFDAALIRALLLDAKSMPQSSVSTVTGFSYPETPQKKTDKYTRQLLEEGLLEGLESRDNPGFFRISGLSEKGVPFANLIEDASHWKEVLEKLNSKGTSSLKALISAASL